MGHSYFQIIGDIDPNAVIVAIVSGGLVGSIVAFVKAPAERFALSTEAQASIIQNLTEENKRLIARNERLELQVNNLREHTIRQDIIIDKQEDRIKVLEDKLGIKE